MKNSDRSKRISKIKLRNRKKSSYATSARLKSEAKRARIDKERSKKFFDTIRRHSKEPTYNEKLRYISTGIR